MGYVVLSWWPASLSFMGIWSIDWNSAASEGTQLRLTTRKPMELSNKDIHPWIPGVITVTFKKCCTCANFQAFALVDIKPTWLLPFFLVSKSSLSQRHQWFWGGLFLLKISFFPVCFLQLDKPIIPIITSANSIHGEHCLKTGTRQVHITFVFPFLSDFWVKLIGTLDSVLPVFQ